MIKRILIVGGANGIGLSIAQEIASRKTTEEVYVVDKVPMQERYTHPKIKSYKFDLTTDDYSFFDRFANINALMITAGFGHLSLFKDIPEQYITDSFNVNVIPVVFIESVNVELLKGGSKNVILNVSPGTIKGTAFYGKENNLDVLHDLTSDILLHLEAKDDLFIPQYEEVFKKVLKRYHNDFRKEGAHSYDYKLNSNR